MLTARLVSARTLRSGVLPGPRTRQSGRILAVRANEMRSYASTALCPTPSSLKPPSIDAEVSSTTTKARTLASAIPYDHCNDDNSRSKSSVGAAPPQNPIPDFNDAQAAYEKKTTAQLAQAALSFGLCQIPILVKHAEGLLSISRKVVGDTATDWILKKTLFGHFCAGEDEKRIQPAIQALEQAGIGSILDFAAEDDGTSSSTTKKTPPADQTRAQAIADEITQDLQPKVRIYDYESESKCDRHVDTFKMCIQHVAELQKDGYAAIKVTALGNPKLLERMSRAIIETQNLFAKFDIDGDGFISREEFERGFHLFFQDDETKLKTMLEQLNPVEDRIDYISWSLSLGPRDLPNITAGCREFGPLAMATPTTEEVELIERMYERGRTLAKEAQKYGTRLLIDAEQARFQPAIDTLVLDLQRTYNAVDCSDKPIIYNTYQCYLKDVPDRLQTDVERSDRFGYHFGAKLVRGAYMESERALAKSLGYPSPIHETIEDTHRCYNDSVRFLLEHAKKSDKQVELMLATHNQESLELAIACMNELGIDRKDPTIAFGQLYGMKDNLTFNLGKHGYRAYKYVPYGEVKMVMPYLVRRANENSSISGGAKQELGMIVRELTRRLRGRALSS